MKNVSRRRGAALLLTLLVVGLLSASVITFIRSVHLDAVVADNARARAQAEVVARTGLLGAMALLAQDDAQVDALTDDWARFEELAPQANILIEEGSFDGRIEDLSARVNINYLLDDSGLVREENLRQLVRLFELLNLDSRLVDAVVDWLDRDDEPRDNGAENPYYLSLSNPYPCGNGPLAAVGQLARIRGLTPEALYGDENRPGLLSLLTVNSSGKINVNTAGDLVLMSLDEEISRTTAEEIISRRREKSFEKLDELREIPGITPEVFNRIINLLTVNSSYYLIGMEGRFRQAGALVTAIVERGPEGVRLLYYRLQ